MSKILAIVLAGGQGKRMDMLCYTRPKPALPFAGSFRVIDFSLSNIIHSGIQDILVLTDYQRAQMTGYLNHCRTTNAGQVNFEVREPANGSYRGTADAIYQNLEYLRKSEADLVLVLAGDHVYKFDYRKMLAFHQQAEADITIGTVTVPLEQAHRFGTISADADCRIVSFVEKTNNPPSNLASMGIYIFEKNILMKRLLEDASQPESPHDFGYAILPKMVTRDRVFAYKFDGYWQDIGTKDAYYAANMELIRQQPSLSLNSHWNILGGNRHSLSVKRLSKGNIQNSLISPDCVIKGRVENSILSPGVRVEENAIVRNSILMSGTLVSRHSIIDHCILDEEVDINECCHLGFGTAMTPGELGITVIGRGTIVPAHTAIGRNSRISPDVKPADFASGIVPRGSFILPQSVGNTRPGKEEIKECSMENALRF
ncbi:MAG: sugar phosphate nucleotidyltransferase [Dehalococcoidales bacterium]|nr:sugar phosphate nucleotidyltransferase [Dehalococcoidales bacterium]